MKTRIISGAVLCLVVAAVVWIGMSFFAPVLTGFIAVVAAIAVYEMLRNAAGIAGAFPVVAGMAATVAAVFCLDGVWPKGPAWLDVYAVFLLYGLLIVVYSLARHTVFGLREIAVSLAFPIVLSYAFSCILFLVGHGGNIGLFYLLMLLNCSAVCDTGAYFTGVAFGKHKLCEKISPKKTVEGAAGGILLSVAVSLLLVCTLGKGHSIPAILLFTVPLCAVGICGDLFASVMKRSVGLKDYGFLIPGHGGIMDRFDSILLIAPVLNFLVDAGVLH